MINKISFKEHNILLSFILIVLFVCGLQAGTDWTNADPANNLWSTDGNWDTAGTPGAPTSAQNPILDLAGSHTLVDSTVAAVGQDIFMATSADNVYLDVTGGTLNTRKLYVSYLSSGAGNNSFIDISGNGAIGVTNFENRYGDLNITISDNGSLTALNFWAARYGGHADINLQGGSLNLTGSSWSILVGSGTMLMDITEGQLTNAGDWVSAYETAAMNGTIVGYGGAGTIVVSYDSGNNQTIVTATAPPYFSNIAYSPTPPDKGAYNGELLYWLPGFYAGAHDVYFGTNFDDVNEALIGFLTGDLTENGVVDLEDLSLMVGFWLDDQVLFEPSPDLNNDNRIDLVDLSFLSDNWLSQSLYKGRYDSNSYDPGQLETGVTYYWRVDEVNDLDVWVGDVWSFTTCQGTAQSDYYVATDGNDLNSGDANNPFATIEKARDTIRNSCSLPDGGVTVWIRGGTYYIDSTIVFDEWDSGEPNKPIVYKNYPDESPMLVGGEPVTDWTIDAGSIYKTYVGTGREFYCLFENGNRSVMARTPNSGYFETETRGDSYTEFGFESGDLSTFDYSDAQVYCWPGSPDWNWFSMTQPITNIDWNTRSITIERGFRSGYNLRTGNRYFVQGAKEFLDSAGEFYLNQSTGWLYYWPVSIPIADQNIIIPTTNILIQFKGGSSTDPVKYITLEGLELAVSDFDDSFREDLSWLENENEYGLVVMENAAYNTVKNCKLVNAGLDGVLLEKYAQNNTIYGNLIENTGRHGVNLSGWLLGNGSFSSAADSYVNKHNLVSNNLIHDVGKLVGHGCGINVYQSGDNEISHNKIYESPRMGIFVTGLVFYKMTGSYYGESVTYSNHWDFLHSKNNEISYNDVSDYGNDSQDLGGIYTWALGKDNDINNNWVHDAKSYVGHCAGIYLDDNSDYVTVSNNIIHDIGSDQKSAKSLFIKGNYNVVTNNIIAFHDTAPSSGYIPFEVQFWMAASEPQYATWYVTFERNILYQPGGRRMFSLVQWDDNRFISCDYNLYYHPGGSYEMGDIPGSDTYATWLTLLNSSFDQNSIVLEDPLFVDPNNRDFDLQPGSPAFGLGFVEIDDESIGLKDDFIY